MKSLIIYAHPWDGSFNHHVLDEVSALLNAKGNEVDVIDLVKDGFNPVMTASDLRLFGRGEYSDPLAKDYVERLKKADELVVIFPLWWYGEPAILKGFYDKVFLKGHTYDQIGMDLVPLLKINKATILTTASIDEAGLAYMGDPINNRLSGGTFAMVGITNSVWVHCASVHEVNNRQEFLTKIAERFK